MPIKQYNAQIMARLSLQDRILTPDPSATDFVRRGKPRWLRARVPQGEAYADLKRLVGDRQLHTVCVEAKCPNMGECWSAGVATLMILGDTCTRACGFCNVKTGLPPILDTDEPRRVAEAVQIMNLQYVVMTSVNRDELPDGGASIWAETIRRTREASPKTRIEVLIPDFCGNWDALTVVIDARPDVLAHNLETVARLHPAVRPQARYDRSLELLRRAAAAGMTTKTGIMVGIGEKDEEVTQLMHDVLDHVYGEDSEPAGPDAERKTQNAKRPILTIGQYLQPSPNHLPVHRFVHPDMFEQYKRTGEALGFAHVESGPMVRSSYLADRQAAAAGV